MVAKFGTSGLRGLVEELDDGTAGRFAAAFARHLLEGGKVSIGDDVFVGQDLRDSSPRIARQCRAALAQIGLKPVDCGALPTPALALHAMSAGAAALMVTGSHIPADRNGVKFYRPDGEIDKFDEKRIGELALGFAPLPEQELTDPRDDRTSALAEFINRYADFIPNGALRGQRIGIYEHSTVARDVFAEILAPTGATLIPLGRSDTFIPVDTEAVSDEVRDQIRRWTREHRLDALVSADGDGDRPLLADERGECLRGDVLGLVAALHVGADAVVTPITSNSGIEARLPAKVWRTRVGSPFVIEAMMTACQSDARGVVGFEANGGMLTATPVEIGSARLSALPTRDCMLPILSVLAHAWAKGLSLSQLVASLKLPVSISGLIREAPTQTCQALMARLAEQPAAREAFIAPFGVIADLNQVDGLRFTLEDGPILHLRPSGNAPEMRVYVEASSEGIAEDVMRRALAHVGAVIKGVQMP